MPGLLRKKAPLLGAFFIAWLFSPALQAFCPPPPAGLPQVRVERVVDGDTLRLQDGRSVRLIGINAPELARRGQPAQPHALAARQYLAQLVAASGERLYLQAGRQARDRYGRSLAHLYDRQGGSLEAQLLAAGMGWQVVVAPNTAQAACLQRAERQARAQRLGVWRQPQWLQPAQLQRGGFALIAGRVQRVERNRGGLWLEMGELVVRIARPRAAEFAAIDWPALQGQRVEVRGWVVERRSVAAGRARWQLSLEHPLLLQPVR